MEPAEGSGLTDGTQDVRVSGGGVAEPDTQWLIVEPGVLVLPTTRFEIVYAEQYSAPFRVRWNGREIPGGAHCAVSSAKSAALRHMRELMKIGLDP